MPHASAGHGTAQHGGHVVLDQEVGKALGTVAAREGDGHGDGTVRADGTVGTVRAVGKEKCPRLPEATPGIA